MSFAVSIRKNIAGKGTRLEEAEFEALFSGCTDKRIRMIMALAHYCGMSPGEIAALKMENIDFEKRRIHAWTSAGRKELYGKYLSMREIRFPDEVQTELDAYMPFWKLSGTKYVVFEYRKGKVGHKLSAQKVLSIFRDYMVSNHHGRITLNTVYRGTMVEMLDNGNQYGDLVRFYGSANIARDAGMQNLY